MKMPAPDLLLTAIRDFIEDHKRDDRYAPTIEALGGVVDQIKKTDPQSGDSPGKLAAKLAARDNAPETPAEAAKTPPPKDTKDAPADPKTFADARTAAMETAKEAAA